MSTQISFYQCDDTIIRSIAPLLVKILNGDNKTLIYVHDQMQMKDVDAGLWAYGKSKFIPHVTALDKDFEDKKQQPVVITTIEDNVNDADYLVLTKEVPTDFLLGFSRVFYFYDPLNTDQARLFAKKCKGLVGKLESYKKENGKWKKAE